MKVQMKLFIKRVLVFLFLIGIIFSLCLVIIHQFSYSTNTLKIDEKTTILVVGDSQIQAALNTNLIDHSYSVAQGGDNHLYNYAQIRSLINKNKQIDTIILGHNYNNISGNYEYYYKTASVIQYKVPKYFSVLELKELQDLFVINSKAMIVTAPLIIKHNINFLLKRKVVLEDLNFGNYLMIDKVYKNPKNKVTFLDKNEYSEIQKKYLHKIVQLCQQKKIKLFLLTTPILFSEQFYTKKFRNKFNSIHFDNVSNVNLADMDLDSTHFYDYVHMNKKGSIIFTTFFRDSILRKFD
jgi:hypothetical protein